MSIEQQQAAFELQLPHGDVQLILRVLGELPYKQVASAIERIVQQISPPPEPAEPVAPRAALELALQLAHLHAHDDDDAGDLARQVIALVPPLR